MIGTSYLHVYNVLKEHIQKGDYTIGSLLPPEPALEQMFRVSRVTVRKAIELLVSDGYVRKQGGVGTIVLNYEITQNLNTLTSLTETLKQRGYEVTVPECAIRVIDADDKLVKRFNMTLPQRFVYIYRLVYASGEPLGIMENYIPYELVEGIERDEGSFVSLYSHLEEKYMLHIEMSKDRIYAQNADETKAEKLHVPEGFALICVKRLCLRLGTPVIYDVLHLRHDKFSYDISLYNRNGAL